jgi:hypothetical protein
VDITEFVKARLDEDEAAAKAATPGPWEPETYIDEDEPVGVEYLVAAPAEAHLVAGAGLGGPQAEKDTAHIARHDPARVLREVAAKRRTLECHASCGSGIGYCDDGGHGIDDLGCGDLIDLAAVWCDHPDYRAEWRL